MHGNLNMKIFDKTINIMLKRVDILRTNIINDITHMRTTSYSCNKCKKVNTESVMIRDMQDMSITLVCCNIIGEEPCSNVWKLEN